jgi:hypothetical protein
MYMNSAAFPAAHASSPIILPGMSRPVATPNALHPEIRKLKHRIIDQKKPEQDLVHVAPYPERWNY